jgi:hypothetical protein
MRRRTGSGDAAVASGEWLVAGKEAGPSAEQMSDSETVESVSLLARESGSEAPAWPVKRSPAEYPCPSVTSVVQFRFAGSRICMCSGKWCRFVTTCDAVDVWAANQNPKSKIINQQSIPFNIHHFTPHRIPFSENTRHPVNT